MDKNFQIMDSLQVQVNSLENQVQKLMTKCSEEIGSQLKEQISNWNEMINQRILKTVQHIMKVIERNAAAGVLTISEGKMKQFIKDAQQEIHKKWDAQEKKGDESTESFKQMEEEVNNLAWEVSEQKMISNSSELTVTEWENVQPNQRTNGDDEVCHSRIEGRRKQV